MWYPDRDNLIARLAFALAAVGLIVPWLPGSPCGCMAKGSPVVRASSAGESAGEISCCRQPPDREPCCCPNSSQRCDSNLTQCGSLAKADCTCRHDCRCVAEAPSNREPLPAPRIQTRGSDPPAVLHLAAEPHCGGLLSNHLTQQISTHLLAATSLERCISLSRFRL